MKALSRNEHLAQVVIAEDGTWDLASASVDYWTKALERIKKRRRIFSKMTDDEQCWKALEKLVRLEEYATMCLELARQKES
jgi:hypothetical protein